MAVTKLYAQWDMQVVGTTIKIKKGELVATIDSKVPIEQLHRALSTTHVAETPPEPDPVPVAQANPVVPANPVVQAPKPTT